MNIKTILSTFVGVSMILSSCSTEEVDLNLPSARTPGIHLRLTGAAAGTLGSRATEAATTGEKTVNNLLAVLFDTHEGFYKTVPATRVGDTDEYTFIVEKDATYDIWLVANASDRLKGELGNIPAGTKMEDENGVNYLESITADQAPDENGNFLMVSKYSEKVTTHITESQSIGEVHMIRLAARFDLLNKAEGVTVTNIEFANRTVKSAVLTPNTMNNASHWFEKKDYTLNVTGDPENGTEWNEHIYTYENHSEAESGQTPALTITYYEGDDATNIKTHEVKLIDPNSTTGKTMPIKRNNLYRIVLTKATKLDFDLQVLDWDAEEPEIKHEDVPLILPKNVQDSLNRQLLVYDLFADKFVKIEKDVTTGLANATFLAPSNPNNIPTEAFYTYNELKSMNLMGSGENAILTIDGQKYRIPTLGELQLISPVDLGYANNNNTGLAPFIMPTFRDNNEMNKEKFTETVYLKNDDKNCPLETENMDDPTVAFTGESQLGIWYNASMTYLDSTDYFVNEASLSATAIENYVCFGIRFRGSSQFSAYRWESGVYDSESGIFYMSCKIKALPEDSKVTLNDIVGNHSFWKDGFIEVKIPCAGYYDRAVKKLKNCTANYLICSTLVPKVNNRHYYLGSLRYRIQIASTSCNSTTSCRMVLPVKIDTQGGTDQAE